MVAAIILISECSHFRETVKKQLRENDWTIFCQSNLTQAKPLLESGAFEFCVIDCHGPLDSVAKELPRIQEKSAGCRFIAISDAYGEGLAHGYHLGFSAILPKPFQAAMLKSVLLRQPYNPSPAMSKYPPASQPAADLFDTNHQEMAKDLSRMLNPIADLPALVHQFVLKVRQRIGVNRIAIFLENRNVADPSASQTRSTGLQCICAIGIPADVQKCVELSSRGGLAGWVFQSGQILRSDQAGASLRPAESTRAQHEFNLLGCHVAVPVNDRERTIGVALLGDHLTRSGFTDDELQLVFHLMEDLGLAVKNNWLHRELTANHRLFGDVLSSLKNGNLVVGRELEIIHANPAMVKFLWGDASHPRNLSFADLPVPVARRVHEVVEKGTSVEAFYFKREENDSRTFRVSVIPFQNPPAQLPQPAIVVMEDFTEVENAKEIAIEAANTKLTSLIATRFANEVRNSLVPLTSHLQLLDERYQEPEFQVSLKQTLETETVRIARFTEQMLFLAESRPPPSILTSVEKLLREGFANAQKASQTRGILTVHNGSNLSCIRCNPQALTQAFQEIFINGLQSNPASPQITVTVGPAPTDRKSLIRIAFRDNGPGFTRETARAACDPFFTSRNSGIGLGLTLASRAAREHDGWLDVHPRTTSDQPDVTMFFPAQEVHE